MPNPVFACRICRNKNLVPVLELGDQALTGVFPKTRDTRITVGPLTLVKCVGEEVCGLLQLAHSYDLEEMYGDNYGYRSGLNPSMVAHLRSKVDRIKRYDVIGPGDIIVDIGSNDATTLRQYELDDCVLLGIDPTGAKFREFYTANINLIPEFFSAQAFRAAYPGRGAKVVTSFSMFYDMEDPMAFMQEVHDILEDGGIWVCEQSYMPLMLSTNSYDTACHEHLEYYAFAQITWMAERVGLRIVDVELNAVNGGSFSFVAQKGGGMPASPAVAKLVESEAGQNLDELDTYKAFAERVERSRVELIDFLDEAKAAGRKVVALGASTKGNVLLQYCGIDQSQISAVGEVNPDKFGAFTPGTLLPIVDERELLGKADHYVVLPWHFRDFFESEPRYDGLDLVYPLPSLSHR